MPYAFAWNQGRQHRVMEMPSSTGEVSCVYQCGAMYTEISAVAPDDGV
jgi:hypothetical protein